MDSGAGDGNRALVFGLGCQGNAKSNRAPIEAAREKKRRAKQVDYRNAGLYGKNVIKTLLHKGLKVFFDTGKKAAIQSHHAPRLGRKLARLDIEPLHLHAPVPAR